jgi:TRAP-type uncharacterized transport system fused permease subunit
LLGSLTGLSGTLLFVFMLFAGLLKSTGGIDFIISMAKRLGGRARSGPAQVAVFGSGFMGTVSGSTVANVASTGSITIPMMMRYGFRPEHAAAIEAVASAGGQFAPPVMGLTAFLIVGMTGIPYRTVMLAAVFPALIYYGNLAVAVHLQAHVGRLGAAKDIGTREGELSSAPQDTLATEFARCSHLLVAVGLLVYLLIRQMPPAYAGLWAILAISVMETAKQLFVSRYKPVAGLRGSSGDSTTGYAKVPPWRSSSPSSALSLIFWSSPAFVRTGREPSAAYRKAAAGHMDVAEVASRAGVRSLVLVHMLRQVDRPGLRERLIAEMCDVYKGNIIWGADLMEVPLSLDFDDSVA